MRANDYKLIIDLENHELSFNDSTGHKKPIKLSYNLIQAQPEILEKFSGSDGYKIGLLLSIKNLSQHKLIAMVPKYKLLILLSILFATTMIVSNILSTKLVAIHGFTITGAMLLYPFSYIFDYIITEIYGYQNARRIILATLAALVIFDLSIYVMIILPPSPYWHYQQEFNDVFMRALRTFLASTVAFSFSFFISSYILQKSKAVYAGSSLFKRIFSALLISEIFDTSIFCMLAFYGVWPLAAMGKFLLLSYFTKVTYELVAYNIITKPLVAKIKKIETLDIVDKRTNFTPFSWEVSYTSDENIFEKKN